MGHRGSSSAMRSYFRSRGPGSILHWELVLFIFLYFSYVSLSGSLWKCNITNFSLKECLGRSKLNIRLGLTLKKNYLPFSSSLSKYHNLWLVLWKANSSIVSIVVNSADIIHTERSQAVQQTYQRLQMDPAMKWISPMRRNVHGTWTSNCN